MLLYLVVIIITYPYHSRGACMHVCAQETPYIYHTIPTIPWHIPYHTIPTILPSSTYHSRYNTILPYLLTYHTAQYTVLSTYHKYHTIWHTIHHYLPNLLNDAVTATMRTSRHTFLAQLGTPKLGALIHREKRGLIR